jgi:aspartyl protease family protein
VLTPTQLRNLATRSLPRVAALALVLAAGAAAATEVALIGQIGGRAAVLSIDGGNPRTLKLNQSWNGITLVSLNEQRATLEINGHKRVLTQGTHYGSARTVQADTRTDETGVVLADDGHFHARASVNDKPMRFLVDTGATTVALPAADAKRLGIDYRSGARAVAQTANGPVNVYRVTLDRIKVGAVDMRSVDAVVMEQGLPTPLLGMSFLNRVDMKREGSTMTFTQRF